MIQQIKMVSRTFKTKSYNRDWLFDMLKHRLCSGEKCSGWSMSADPGPTVEPLGPDDH